MVTSNRARYRGSQCLTALDAVLVSNGGVLNDKRLFIDFVIFQIVLWQLVKRRMFSKEMFYFFIFYFWGDFIKTPLNNRLFPVDDLTRRNTNLR